MIYYWVISKNTESCTLWKNSYQDIAKARSRSNSSVSFNLPYPHYIFFSSLLVHPVLQIEFKRCCPSIKSCKQTLIHSQLSVKEHKETKVDTHLKSLRWGSLIERYPIIYMQLFIICIIQYHCKTLIFFLFFLRSYFPELIALDTFWRLIFMIIYFLYYNL